MTKWTKDEIDKTLAKVMEKTVTNPDFRKLALSDPQAAIKTIANKELPEGYQIKFVDSDPSADMTFLLPPAQCEELSEEEMAGVAAGGSWYEDTYGHPPFFF